MDIPVTDEKYGIVVLLDALGVKGIWKDRNPKEILDQWKSVISSIDVDRKESKDIGMDLQFRAFSDTLIITLTNGNPEEMLQEIAITLSSLHTFAMSFGINFRGAFSIGKFFESELMIIGPAIDEAAMYFEQANWIYIHATPSAWSFIKKNPKLYDVSYIEYDVPTHGKPFKSFVPIPTNALGESMQEETKTKTMLDFMHKHLEESSEPEGFEKWKNTLDLMYYCKEKIGDSF